MCLDNIMRGKKLRELCLSTRKFGIIALQEVHGNDVAARMQSTGILRSHMFTTPSCREEWPFQRGLWWSWVSICKEHFVWGDDGSPVPLATFSPQEAHTFLMINIPGRAISLRICDSHGLKCVSVHNARNFELPIGRMHILAGNIKSDIAMAKGGPTNKSVLLVGDFHLQPADEAKTKMDCPSAQGIFQNGVGPFSGRWKSLFDLFAEIQLPQPNHFASATNCVNKLARIFVFVCRSVLPSLADQAGVVNDPLYFHGLGLSDHAPMFWQLHIKAKQHGKAMRLQPAWCRHPAYKIRMENLCRLARLDDHPLPTKSVYLKELMRDAAIHARDVIFNAHPNCKHGRLPRLGSIAKAVWTGGSKLYKIGVSSFD